MDKEVEIRKILVVEDDPQQLKSAVFKDFDVILTSNAKDALSILDKEFIFLVLTDMWMPMSAHNDKIESNAGLYIVKECISRGVPCAVVTKVFHGGIYVKILMPYYPVLLCYNNPDDILLVEINSIPARKKDEKVWNFALNSVLKKLIFLLKNYITAEIFIEKC